MKEEERERGEEEREGWKVRERKREVERESGHSSMPLERDTV